MKKLLSCILCFLTACSFAACDLQFTEPSDEGGNTSSTQRPGDNTNPDDGGDEEPPPVEDGTVEYTVRLTLEGAPFTETTDMYAQWTDGYNYYRAPFNEEGVASITVADEDYTVSLIGLSEDYAYFPGGDECKTSKITPSVTIPVYELLSARGKGTYEFDCKALRGVGVYREEFDSADEWIYYEFTPKENGVYTFESWVDVAAGVVNPKLHVFGGSIGYKNYLYTQDDGSKYSKGYTTNFLYTIKVDDSNVGNTWTFALSAEHKDGAYPTSIVFSYSRNGDFERGDSSGAWMLPHELYEFLGDELIRLRDMSKEQYITATAEFLLTRPTYADGEPTLMRLQFEEEYEALTKLDPAQDLTGTLNIHNAIEEKLRYGDPLMSDGSRDGDCWLRTYLKEYFTAKWAPSGTWVGPETEYKTALVFRGENYKANGNDSGFYAQYDVTTKTYGKRLYGSVSTTTRFIARPFTTIEYEGNKNLTVENATQNYKLFIEGYDGMVYMAEATQLGMPVDFPEEYNNMFGYADFATNGVVPVTEELKEFFQKYSVSQRLFNDGNGFAETNGTIDVDALEDDQWLFACGYYS